MTARHLIGDVFEQLATLEDNSVDLVMTSPPFLALRSYLPADHPDKAKEIGSEPTPAAFIDTLLDLVEALDRVLAPHGSLCFELGDTYSGSTADGSDNQGNDRYPAGRSFVIGKRDTSAGGWPLAKSLRLIPESFRWALVYGRNPFNGRTTPPWRVRNVVRWHRPNPPVGALGDKFRPSTSDLVIACKSAKRYFDLDAVRTEYKPGQSGRAAQFDKEHRKEIATKHGDGTRVGNMYDGPGAPPLDTWIIPTAPYKGSHYATFPPDLCIIPIKAMCPEKVCRVCGEPSRRIVETEYEPHGNGRVDENKGVRGGAGASGEHAQHMAHGRATKVTETTGWTDCGHNDYRNGAVLDPFAGSGTTLAVATGHGRDAIGIDLDERNADLARERVGMFLTIEEVVG